MSDSEGSNSDEACASDFSLVSVESYTRDPKYYYSDGSTVFLVEDVLFKFQASLLAPNLLSRNHEFEYITRDLFDCSTPSSGDKKGSSDANPITIAGIETKQFRDFLLAMLGRPGDPEYMCLLMDPQHDRNHTQATFIRYLNIGDMAVRFGTTDLERWVWSQLGFLLKSADILANYEWDKDTLVKVLSYLDRLFMTERLLARKLFAFVLLALSMSTGSPLMPGNQSTPTLNTCVQLYKELSASTRKYDNMTFGYVFIVILSLGHHSPTWTNELTRDDRAVLYAAQAHLTSLRHDKELDLAWLAHPRASSILEKTCSACLNNFDDVWNASFGQCGAINSAVPLRDVSELVILPQSRQIFARAIRSSSWRCEFQCGMNILRKIDAKIERLFLDFAWKHRRFITIA